jgi:hypothetical protein
MCNPHPLRYFAIFERHNQKTKSQFRRHGGKNYALIL